MRKVLPMVAFLASLALSPLALSATLAHTAVPLETQAAECLRKARQNVVSGQRDRGCASLDSLVMKDGVTVAMESANPADLYVAKGIEAWNVALGEPVFQFRPAGTPADVTVRFVRSLASRGGDVQGFVDATRQMSWGGGRGHAYKLRATIYVRDNVEGRPLRPEEIMNVVAHETGHLLGLADNPRVDRLMGPMVVGRAKVGPTPEEAGTVRQYRDLVRRCYPKV